MIIQIKNKIERELPRTLRYLDRRYSIPAISSLISKEMRLFALGKGKRLRPIFLVLAYKGFAKYEAPGLYRTALSLELLHDFLIIHDDIIDRSPARRGRPSLHKRLAKYLKKKRHAKFTGEDLAIVIGDIMYALAIDTFLSIRENSARKERALEKFIRATALTGLGEGAELLYTLKGITRISKSDIEAVYDLKTASYSFASPLVIGATLGGASKLQSERLFKGGLFTGRAFQIRDDILGIFGEQKHTGKSPLTDLKEGKLTLLLWHAFHSASKNDKLTIKRMLAKKNAKMRDLLKLRRILTRYGSLEYATQEIERYIKKAEGLIMSSALSSKYKNLLINYAKELLT